MIFFIFNSRLLAFLCLKTSFLLFFIIFSNDNEYVSSVISLYSIGPSKNNTDYLILLLIVLIILLYQKRNKRLLNYFHIEPTFLVKNTQDDFFHLKY